MMPIVKCNAIGEEAVDDIDSAGELYSVSNALKLTFAPHSVNMPRSTIQIRLIKNMQIKVYVFSQMLLTVFLLVNQVIINTSSGIIAIYAVADASMRMP